MVALSTGTVAILAKGDVLFREGLALVLERQDYEVVGVAGVLDEFVNVVEKHSPDLAVVDLQPPPTDTVVGLEVAQRIGRDYPSTALLVLATHVVDAGFVPRLFERSGIGLMLKRHIADIGEFARALERLRGGGSWIDPEIATDLITGHAINNRLAGLTERECDVLSLMAEGRSNAGIAQRLFISEGTVEKHIGSLLAKLDVPDGAHDHRRVLAVLRYLETLT
jgi:DNA-binding NarL/FixJ family response regulator